MHIVLLGDSIFDNAAYVSANERSVAEHLRALTDAKVTLLAVDGHVTVDVIGQLAAVPRDATHLVVSVGGNDALGCWPVLNAQVATVYDALLILARLRREFLEQYRRMLGSVAGRGLPVALCTIYDRVPNLPDPERTALALFNEAITSEASRLGIPIIDLRHVCNEDVDYSAMSAIEPSHLGGLKIAKAVLRAVRRD